MEPLRDNGERSRLTSGQHVSTRTSQHLQKNLLQKVGVNMPALLQTQAE